MNVWNYAEVNDFMPHYGDHAVDCGGARIRAQSHHLATILTISGAIDAANIDQIAEYSRRLILVEKPIVIDLSCVDSFATQGIRLLDRLDMDCRIAGLEWAFIASRAVTTVLDVSQGETTFPTVASVREALNYFADAICTRRQILLPLFAKTA